MAQGVPARPRAAKAPGGGQVTKGSVTCAVRSCRSPNPGMSITWVNTAVHVRCRAETGDRHGTVIECAPPPS